MRAVEIMRRVFDKSNSAFHRPKPYLLPVITIIKVVSTTVKQRVRITNFTIFLIGALLGLCASLILLRGFLFSPGVVAYWDLHWWYSSSIYPMHHLWDEGLQSPVVVNNMLGLLPFYLFPSEFGERLLFVSMFTIMGMSMFFTAFKLTAPRHTTARVPLIAATLATLFFMLNPVVCTWWWCWDLMWYYAFLPLLLYFSYTAFRDIHSLRKSQFLKRAILIALVLSVMAVCARMPIYFPILILAFFAGFSRPFLGYLKRSVLLTGLVLVLYMAFSAVWLIPTTLMAEYTPYWYVTTRQYLYAATANSDSTLPNVVTLQAIVSQFLKQIFTHSGSLATMWKVSVIAIPVIAFASFLFRRSKLVIWLVIFALAFIFLGKGTNPPFGGFYEWLAFDSPVFSSIGWVIRKPYLWHMPQMFCYAVLAGLTISYLLGFIKDKRRWSKLRKVLFVLLIPVFVAVPLISGYPLLSGDMNGTMKPRELTASWISFNQWMEDEGSEGKIIDHPAPPWWGLPRARLPHYYSGIKPVQSFLFTPFIRDSLANTVRLGELQSVYNSRYLLLWSDQVGSNREAVFAAIDRQEDLKLVQQFGPIYLYESSTDSSLIKASDQSVVALGGLDNMLTLTTIDAYNFGDFPVVFLDQSGSSSDCISEAKILLSNQGNMDLYLSLLDQDYVIKPFDHVDLNPETQWQKATIPYWYYQIRNVGLKLWQHDYGEKFVWAQGRNPLDMSFSVDNTGNYDVFVRCLHSEYSADGIEVSLDSELIGQVVTRSDIGEFRWDNLGTYNLPAGEHTLTLQNVRGFNAVNLLAVVPHGEVERYEEQVDNSIADIRLIYLWEAETALNISDSEVSDKYNGNASNGAVVNLSTGAKAWRDIEVLRSDEYRMVVRLNGSVRVGINNESFSVGRDELGFAYLDPIYLEKGIHRIELKAVSGGNSDLDVIWLYSVEGDNETIDDIFISEVNSARVIEYEKLSPTRYRATVTSDQPFMLSFAEAYHRLWIASVSGKEYPSVPLNSIGNGFWIEDTGELEIIIEFKPQRWFYWGAVISGLAVFCSFAFLFWNWKRKKWRWLRHPIMGNIQNAARTNVERFKKKVRSGNSVPE